MPTTDEPALGRAPSRTISACKLRTAFDLLGVVDPTKREELRAAITVEAGRYVRWRKQEGVTPPLPRQKAQLAKVKDAAGRLAEELKKLASHLDAEFALLYQLERLSRDTEIFNATGLVMTMNIDDVRDLIVWLRDGVTSASSFLDARSGPTSRPSLHLFVLSLCGLFEQITGKPATHNPYLKTEYKGRPQSAAGRFIEIIVRLVDSKVTPMQISTAMARAVRELQRLRAVN